MSNTLSITELSVRHKVSLRQSGVLLQSTPSKEWQSLLVSRNNQLDVTRKKRGQIKGFSNRSAMRLRQKLICFDYSQAFEMALTAPPYAVKSPESVLKQFGKHISRFGDIAIVWRKEVTYIGTVHYHLIVWSHNHSYAHQKLCEHWANGLFPRKFDYTSIVPDILNSISPSNQSKWLNETGQVGILEFVEMGYPINPAQVEKVPYKNLCDWCRARTLQVNEHKENFRTLEGVGFIKYILDHTSKHKEYQSKTLGRAWGIINQEFIPRSISDDFLFTRHQWDVFLRLLGKMSRNKVLTDCQFGYKLTHRKQYNSCRIWGRSAQFLDVEPLRRLVRYVTDNC